MDQQVNQFNLVFWFLQFLIVNAFDEPEVVLTTGRVRGLKLVSAANRAYYSFRGIPYAAPPVGNLRFKAPQPPKIWNGTLEAFDIPPACSQPWRKLQFPETYNEDCLFINVFTPYLKPPKDVLMPVMVWIHGGKQYQGSSTSYKYGADFLITEDVVVVTFNYRLGVFGYLSLETKGAQGNAAAKDKVAALRWVQREISKFGGDPKIVTIFGGSSGGQDVNCLYLSPMSQGLFHRAISQSSPGCGTKFSSHNFNPGVKLAGMLGCPLSDIESVVACLRSITAQVLAEIQMNVIIPGTGEDANPFGLTIEVYYGEEEFMAVPPEELLKKSCSEVPFLMGMNSGEGQMDVENPEDNPSQFSDFERDFVSYLPNYICQHANQKTLRNIARKLKSFYFDDEPISLETVNGFIDFMTDRKFTYHLAQAAKALSAHAPVYLYYFTFEGEFETRHPGTDGLNLTGVNHGEELGYLFYRNVVTPEQNDMADYPREYATLTRMVRLWTNFAKYGNPTPNKSDGLLGVTWLPMNGSITQHLVINDSLSMDPWPLLPGRVALWEDVFYAVRMLGEGEPQVLVGLTILAIILILALISLLYLLYSSSCVNVYEEL